MGKRYKSLAKDLIEELEKPVMTNVGHLIENVPIEFVFKERSQTPDPLDQQSTFGWKLEYKGRQWGNYIVMNIDNPDKETLRKCKKILLEQANDVFIHRALLADVSDEGLLEEILYRLRSGKEIT